MSEADFNLAERDALGRRKH